MFNAVETFLSTLSNTLQPQFLCQRTTEGLFLLKAFIYGKMRQQCSVGHRVLWDVFIKPGVIIQADC